MRHVLLLAALVAALVAGTAFAQIGLTLLAAATNHTMIPAPSGARIQFDAA